MNLSAVAALLLGAALTTTTEYGDTLQTGATMRCLYARHLGRRHTVACLNLDTNEVLGATLKRNGAVACTIGGYRDGNCLVLAGTCGSGITCR